MNENTLGSTSRVLGRAPYLGLLLIAVVVIWGVTWPVMKLGLDYISPLFFGSIRMFIGAGCVFVFSACVGRITLPGRNDIWIVLSVGLLQMAIPTALMHFSLSYVDAGRASLLAFTHPIWIVPAAVFFLKEPLNKGTFGGLIVGIAGLLVLFNPVSFDWTDRNVLIGNGLLICSAMSWAAGIIHVRAHNWRNSPLSLCPWQMLVAGVVLLILSVAREDISSTNWQPELVAILGFVGIASTAFCYWGAVTVSKQLPVMVSSLGFLGVPVVGILSSAVMLSENITKTLMTGTGFVLLGIIIMAAFGRQSNET